MTRLPTKSYPESTPSFTAEDYLRMLDELASKIWETGEFIERCNTKSITESLSQSEENQILHLYNIHMIPKGR